MKKFVFLCLLAAAILGVSAGLFLAYKLGENYSSREPVWETSMRVLVDPRSLFPGKDSLTVLILGTDYNYTRQDIVYTKNSRSDTIVLVRLNLPLKTVKVLSIPRDTRVIIPGEGGHDRVNSAFAIGGPKLAEAVIQDLVQTPVDFYIRLKEEGLKNFVDAIGGVDLDVEKNMNYDDRWGYLHIHLKKGFQHLDGEQVAEYSRFRHDPEGDYGRIRRQQQVIQAIKKRLGSPAALTHFADIVETGRKNIETDLSAPQLLALANLLKGISPSSARCLTLPTLPKDYQEGGYWVSYVVVDEDKAREVLAQFLSDAAPEPSSATGNSLGQR